MNRPDVVQDEHLTYLDGLRESLVTNMLGAVPYIVDAFPTVSVSEARSVLKYWMSTFGSRHGYEK